jgi:hypothetical protein
LKVTATGSFYSATMTLIFRLRDKIRNIPRDEIASERQIGGMMFGGVWWNRSGAGDNEAHFFAYGSSDAPHIWPRRMGRKLPSQTQLR